MTTSNSWVFNQPAVIAAVVAGCVAIVVLIVNTALTYRLHRSKMQADKRLAEDKFEFDRALSETKFFLDRSLSDWKRNAEFAEQALADFYEAASRFTAIRSPGSLGNENHDRVGRDAEPPAIRASRDTYYPYLRRIRMNADFFDAFHARRFRAAALFGVEASAPYEQIRSSIHKVNVAAGILVSRSRGETPPHLQETLEGRIWEGIADPDEIAAEVAAAVSEAEAIFRPAIAALPDTAPDMASTVNPAP